MFAECSVSNYHESWHPGTVFCFIILLRACALYEAWLWIHGWNFFLLSFLLPYFPPSFPSFFLSFLPEIALYVCNWQCWLPTQHPFWIIFPFLTEFQFYLSIHAPLWIHVLVGMLSSSAIPADSSWLVWASDSQSLVLWSLGGWTH